MAERLTWTGKRDLPDIQNAPTDIEAEQVKNFRTHLGDDLWVWLCEVTDMLEKHRNPIRLELVRVVLPAILGVFFLGVVCGYAWRMLQTGG